MKNTSFLENILTIDRPIYENNYFKPGRETFK